jgi:hypothetical protein
MQGVESGGVALLRIETAVFVSEIGCCDFE